jgi:hypothetical protein
MRHNQSNEEAHAEFQSSIENWGKLLAVTGGALKPAKCSYYFISFTWKNDGTWRYRNNELSETFGITVPAADGTGNPIEHLPITKAVKTLGYMMCPTGDSTKAVQQMKAAGQV